jgi:hypothetical protein
VPLQGLQEELRHGCIAVIRIESEFALHAGRSLRRSKAREESVADRYKRATIFATLPKKRSATGPEHLCLS